jgi:hypothetical protein
VFSLDTGHAFLGSYVDSQIQARLVEVTDRSCLFSLETGHACLGSYVDFHCVPRRQPDTGEAR